MRRWMVLAVLAVALVMVILAGCEITSPAREGSVNDIRYLRDGKTGICFAMISSATYGMHRVVSISAVRDDACAR